MTWHVIRQQSTRVGDPLFSYINTGRFSEKNRVYFEEFTNWKTGVSLNVSHSAIRQQESISPAWEYPENGFFWSPNSRVEDGYPEEEAIACYEEIDHPSGYRTTDRFEVNQYRSFENGTVFVSCGRFEGHVRKVSEPVYGCYYNETVYELGKKWLEPNPGEKWPLKRIMMCTKPNDGYFESKLVGCTKENIYNTTDKHIKEIIYYDEINLNSTNEEAPFFKCVETKPGNVELVEVNHRMILGCVVDNVWHQRWTPWKDDKRGAIFQCEDYEQYEKKYCYVAGRQFEINRELKLTNGCTFLCHPQTNIYNCDQTSKMFKVVGKPRMSKLM
ncbi:hypothetical protein GCK72_023028 [Caenorhabditis remanei]|uniref:Uncharacterized protein n=1 Tax=Caenorhabditis remanei TaxID=31234 RepID=A0A6A5FVW5_CAERE|nr:hypothetical protein GCK72_023028 [Caenorhabditis remanei]KAF1746571.1 hypothetical protein GCK72_023028 [Caenorhabditis remanei]